MHSPTAAYSFPRLQTTYITNDSSLIHNRRYCLNCGNGSRLKRTNTQKYDQQGLPLCADCTAALRQASSIVLSWCQATRPVFKLVGLARPGRFLLSCRTFSFFFNYLFFNFFRGAVFGHKQREEERKGKGVGGVYRATTALE
jgi:hypothetical protein